MQSMDQMNCPLRGAKIIQNHVISGKENGIAAKRQSTKPGYPKH